MLAQDVEAQHVRPPVLVSGASASASHRATARKRALATTIGVRRCMVFHCVSLIVCVFAVRVLANWGCFLWAIRLCKVFLAALVIASHRIAAKFFRVAHFNTARWKVGFAAQDSTHLVGNQKSKARFRRIVKPIRQQKDHQGSNPGWACRFLLLISAVGATLGQTPPASRSAPRC